MELVHVDFLVDGIELMETGKRDAIDMFLHHYSIQEPPDNVVDTEE
jgi:hypothetical protein